MSSCFYVSNNIGFNVATPTTYDFVILNNYGNNFNLDINLQLQYSGGNPICGNQNLYFLVIMNSSINDSLTIFTANQTLLKTKTFEKQTCVAALGKFQINNVWQEAYTVKIQLKTSDGSNIDANSIKIIATSQPDGSYSSFDFWPKSTVLDGFYIADIGTNWIQLINATKVDGKTTYSQKASIQNLGPSSSIVGSTVTNNLPNLGANRVLIRGMDGKNVLWSSLIPGTDLNENTVTLGGFVKTGLEVSYNSTSYDPLLQPNVNLLAWTLPTYGVNFPLTTNQDSYGYLDCHIEYGQIICKTIICPAGYNTSQSYINANTAILSFGINGKRCFYGDAEYLEIYCNDVGTFTISIYVELAYTYSNKYGSGLAYKTLPYITGSGKQGYFGGRDYSYFYRYGATKLETLVLQGPDSIVIGPLPSVPAPYISGSAKFVSSVNIVPYPTGSPVPSMPPTPTPTPSPSATMDPTPSPSGTEPTGTPYPTVTPLPVVAPGRMWFAGGNNFGNLGTNNTITYSSPVQTVMQGLWKQVTFSMQSYKLGVAAIKNDDTLWLWGQFTSKNGDSVPALATLSSPIQIVGGGTWKQINENFGLKSDGTIWAWNYGNKTDPAGFASSPTQITALGGDWFSFETFFGTFALIKNDRTLWTLAGNTYGQAGTNNTIDYSSPVQTVYRTNDWSQISLGNAHILAVKSDGTLWSWGLNSDGQLGINSSQNKSTPTQVGSNNTWINVLATNGNSYGIKNDGTLWAWGSTPPEGPFNVSSPVLVSMASGYNWKKLIGYPELFNQPIILLDNLGRAYLMPAFNESGQMGDNQTWQIAPGQPLPLFTYGSNTQWLTGDAGYYIYPNSSVQFSFNALIEDVNPTVTPTTTPTPSATDPTPTPTATITTATPTQSPSATPTSTPTVSPTTTPSPTPSDSPFPTPSPTPSPTPTFPPLILVDDNNLFILGDTLLSGYQSITAANYEYKLTPAYLRLKFLQNGYASVNLGTTQGPPVVPGTLTINPTGNLADIIIFDFINSGDMVWQGQVFENGYVTFEPFVSPTTISTESILGNVSFSTTPPNPTPTPAATLTPLQPKNGRLFLWGSNAYGQLGQGNLVSISSPVQTIFSTADWNSCDIKYNHILSVKDSGQLWVWGNNSYGQLGLNNTISYSSPVQASPDNSDWNFVSAGYSFSLAVNQFGELWSWGRNNFGQLGIGNSVDVSSPNFVPFPSFFSCKNISAGYSHAAMILSDNSLWLWGDNSYGACGYSDVPSFSQPIQIQVTSVEDWENVVCGKHYTLAVQKNGKMWAWGLNDQGQYGNGTVVTSSNPILIESGSAVWNFISAGEKFSVGGVNAPIGTPVPTVTPTPSPTPSATFNFPTPTPT